MFIASFLCFVCVYDTVHVLYISIFLRKATYDSSCVFLFTISVIVCDFQYILNILVEVWSGKFFRKLQVLMVNMRRCLLYLFYRIILASVLKVTRIRFTA